MGGVRGELPAPVHSCNCRASAHSHGGTLLAIPEALALFSRAGFCAGARLLLAGGVPQACQTSVDVEWDDGERKSASFREETHNIGGGASCRGQCAATVTDRHLSTPLPHAGGPCAGPGRPPPGQHAAAPPGGTPRAHRLQRHLRQVGGWVGWWGARSGIVVCCVRRLLPGDL